MTTEYATEFPRTLVDRGGPGNALMKRLRLIRPELGGASGRTAIILASITWLPLLTFSLIEGLALGGIPLLYRYCGAYALCGCDANTGVGRDSNR
jgi:hypothetical protein